MIPFDRLGWMAGIIEIQGRVRRIENPKRRHPQLTLIVESSATSIVKELCFWTGKDLKTRPAKIVDWHRRGCAEHCPEPHVHTPMMPEIATWSISGAAAAIILYNVLPFCVSGHGYQSFIDDALAQIPRQGWGTGIARGQGSGAINASIKRLTDLGWALPPELKSTVPSEGEAA